MPANDSNQIRIKRMKDRNIRKEKLTTHNANEGKSSRMRRNKSSRNKMSLIFSEDEISWKRNIV